MKEFAVQELTLKQVLDVDQLSEDIPSAYVDQVNNGLCIELTPEAYKDKMSDQELEQVRQHSSIFGEINASDYDPPDDS